MRDLHIARTAEEVARAHDVLSSILDAASTLAARDPSVEADPEFWERVHVANAMQNVLCWVLGHGENFKQYIDFTETALREAVEEVALQHAHRN